MSLIKPLIEYQNKEKEKLDLVASVDGGKVKRELDESNRMLDTVKRNVLHLEDEAKSATSLIEAIKKNMGELLMRSDEIAAKDYSSMSEEELESAETFAKSINQKVIGYERQLSDLVKKIDQANTAFEDAKQKMMRSQKMVQQLTPMYEEQKSKIANDVSKIDTELKTMSAKIDKKLMEVYKKARTNDKSGKNLVVKLSNDRCGGCHFELPLSMTHKIDVDGYIVCEECSKIIHK